MPRVYVFIPIACDTMSWNQKPARIVRFGFTATLRNLNYLFSGLNDPKYILLDEHVPDGRAACDYLERIFRLDGSGFDLCSHGYNWRSTRFTVQELKDMFARVANGLREAQPRVQVRSMSSEQAAAILCGVLGSIEDVVDN